MARPWYAHFVADYERKTSHLSMLEHGAYRLLLDHYYATGKPLTLELDRLFRVCRATSRIEKATVSKILNEFFEPKEDGFHNRRADEEIADAEERQARKAMAGHKGGMAARGKSGRKPNSERIADEIADVIGKELQENTQSPSQSHSPSQKEAQTPIPSSQQTGILKKNGFEGKNGVGIADQSERLARFQATIARAIGNTGWSVVSAAVDPASPEHEQAIAVCKATAKKLGKGWPHAWH